MTQDVVQVPPETGFREIVTLLAEFDITAVPVVDGEGRPVGVVSEADLVRIQAAQGFPSPPSEPGALTAGELMTSPPSAPHPR
ncbi:CBS domain-containing protein [Streptomyces stramineus]